MQWANQLSPVTGKQILTEDRPITAIHRAIKEIQDSVVTAATVTINGTPMNAVVRDNGLEIDGEIAVGAADVDLSPYALGGSKNPRELPTSAITNQVLTWNGSAWVAGAVRAI